MGRRRCGSCPGAFVGELLGDAVHERGTLFEDLGSAVGELALVQIELPGRGVEARHPGRERGQFGGGRVVCPSAHAAPLRLVGNAAAGWTGVGGVHDDTLPRARVAGTD
jgi:hypothetical protein